MHPRCCITLESVRGGIAGPASQELVPLDRIGSFPTPIGSEGQTVAGVLYKWTNFGKGWRWRWFALNTSDGSISYSKFQPCAISRHEVRLIGDLSSTSVGSTTIKCGPCDRDGRGGRRSRNKFSGVVNMKVSSFRESKSDDRRFYIFTSTKTLHLRTDSKTDKAAWLQALLSTKILLPLESLNSGLSSYDISFSTVKLRNRLLEAGIEDIVVSDCEQIVLSEFREIRTKFNALCHERSNLLNTIRQLEAANAESETSAIHLSDYRLNKHRFLSLGYSATESSEETEKQEGGDEGSDEEKDLFHDTDEYFREAPSPYMSVDQGRDCAEWYRQRHNFQEDEMHSEASDLRSETHIKRREKLPDPIETETRVSLWSMIKDNVGKDLTKVCLPVYFNEPISLLQKCFEDLEYSDLLDRACEYGKAGNSLLRILNVAAFAVSGYSSSKGRHCKPFNPLLGETYEAKYPEKGIRFLSEKVNHHPTLMACHCEGRGWKFYGDSNLCSKFWGQSIQLDPVGVLTLEFDDGEIFQWSKVTSTIYNIILGKLYCDHHGEMHIRGNRQYSCKLKFKEHSILERNPHQVHGYVEDALGKRAATLYGKWDESIYYVDGEAAGKAKDPSQSSNATLLWQITKPPFNHTRYNLTSFAISLNELTPGLLEKLPPTDSRLRPDQRHLENGEYGKANTEKQRLEKRQRMSRKLQLHGWKPRWFKRDPESETFRYVGGYWEAREQGTWDECPNIFGDFNEESLHL